MLIIGIAGKIGTGKDYATGRIASLLPKEKGVINLAFADQIRVNVSVRDKIYLPELMKSQKKDEHRKLLQKEGTENGRDKLGTNVWVNTVDGWITIHEQRFKQMGRPLEVVIISDCRFPNEVDWVISKGGIVLKMVAPKRNQEAMERTCDPEKIRNHPSETSLDDYVNDKVIEVKNDMSDKPIDEQLKEIFNTYL